MSNGRYVANAADILFGSYIKYERLDQLLSQFDRKAISGKNINIAIDAESITRRLVVNQYEVVIDDPYLIASCLINLAIHLRAYFVTRYQNNPTVFLIYSSFNEKPYRVDIESAYNVNNIQAYQNNQYMTNLIHDNLEIMDVLTKYLERIYYIPTDDEFIVGVEEVKAEQAVSNALWIVYSKDPMAYQSVAYRDSTIMLRPKKSMDLDVSYLVYKSQLFNIYRLHELSNKNFTKEYDTPISLFDLFLAMNGIRSRHLMALCSSTSALKRIQLAIENKQISTLATLDQIGLCTSLGVDLNVLAERLDAISFRYLVNKAMTRYDWSTRLMRYMGDLNAPQDVQAINNTYFQKYPIDLNRV